MDEIRMCLAKPSQRGIGGRNEAELKNILWWIKMHISWDVSENCYEQYLDSFFDGARCAATLGWPIGTWA